MWYIYLALGLAAGALGVYLLIKPKLKQFKTYDLETEQKNNRLQNDLQNLNQEVENLNSNKNSINLELNSLISRRDEIQNSLEIMNEQAKKSAEAVYNEALEVAASNFEQSANKLRKDYDKFAQGYEDSIQTLMVEASSQLNDEIAKRRKEIDFLKELIAKLRSEQAAAVEAAKRAEEIRNQADFYRLHLSDLDISEIKLLREVEPHLRNKEPLNKVIWKCYYENPTNDLIGRILGNGTHMGIYKITNLENDMCYIGQSVNIADRWKQHIKRGIGADTPTRNKLYPAMLAIGVENFSFELIEECTKDRLDEREDYWQEFFHAKEFGYSIK